MSTGSVQPPGIDVELDVAKSIAAGCEEGGRRSRQKISPRQLPRAHISKLADTVLSSSEGQPTYAQKLGQLLRETRTQLPTVTIEYRGLSVEADALVGSGSNPSVGNAFKAAAKAATFQGGLKTRPVQLLRDVNGVLAPGRMTLLLGPPGAGKSLLLKVLSGRLQRSKHLRVSGTVLYNGRESRDFVIRRTAGLVEQQDYHMPTLTVLETVAFAAKCQNPLGEVGRFLEEVDRAAISLRSRKISALQERWQSGTRRGLQPGSGGGGDDGGVNGGGGCVDAAERGEAGELEMQAHQNACTSGNSGPISMPTQAESTGSSSSSSSGGGGGDNGTQVATAAKEAAGGEVVQGSSVKSFDGAAVLPPELFDEEFYQAFREVACNRLTPHLVLGIMGLSHCADTMVGNNFVRGISGGECKRLTTAEILAGPQCVVLMDEISTGLDSATAFSVVRTLRDAAHSLQRTLLISLLQPAPEVLHLFDDVLLLTEGRIMYHGPVDQVLPFFSGLGYTCPPRKDPGSFLQEVSTPLGQMAYATPELLAIRGVAEEQRTPEALLSSPPKELLTTIDEVADTFWRKSEWGSSMLWRLQNRPFDKAAGSPHALFTTRFANSPAYLTGLLFKRLGLLSLRMRGFYIARVVQTAVMALVIGSLFSGIQPVPEDGRTVLAVCALSIIFLSLSSMPQLGLVFATKRVFYKHRDNNFFPAWSYVAGMTLVQVPQSTLEAVVYTCIVYFLTNLTRTASHFFIFLVITWSASNCLAGLFRLLAYTSQSLVAGNAAGGLLLLLMMLTNGFTIVRPSIPPYMVWLYWINPLSFSIRAVAVNELTSERWATPLPAQAGAPTLGIAVLQPFGFYTEQYWIWVAVGFLWGSLFCYTVAGALALRWTNPAAPRATVPEEEQKEEVVRGLAAALRRQRRRLGAKKSARKALGSGSCRDGYKADPGAATPGAATALTAFPLAPPSAAPAAAARAAPGRQCHVVVPFTPITLVCRRIHYYVDDPSRGNAPGVVRGGADKEVEGKLELLQGVSMHALPGHLTALMGGSGAGKTTLMDVVCGRKTVGLVRGEILVNGHPKQQASWSRVVGYVEQADVHSAGTTVREALMFSARLRLDEATISLEQVKAIVEETMEMVELGRLAGCVVGSGDGEWGLSLEQRKRLSIAVELVANPSVVFMDEPTSGLDARAAAIVMRAVENVARSSRTVVVTIHQPSCEIFEAFDQLVLLQLGGRLTYFGPLGYESCELIAYLQACPGVEPIRPGYNPATWMLEVTGGSMTTVFKHAGGDFPAIYEASELRRRNEERMDQLAEAGRAASAPLQLPGRWATSLSTQRRWLLARFFAIYWRTPEYNFVRLVMSLVLALLYGITFINQGRLDESGVEIKTVQNIMGLTFSFAIFQGMFNAMTVQPVVAAERVVFYRETAASMYSPAPYSLAMGMAELPYLAAQALVMVCTTYWLVGFQAVAWKFFFYLLTFFLSLTMFTFFGQMLVFLTPNILLASLLCAACNQLWTMFCGFLIPYTQMPAGWKWMNRISPTTWILYGLGGSQLADSNVPLVGIGGVQTTVSEFMKSYFDYEPGFVWWTALILFGYVVTFRVCAVLLLRHISFQRR